MKSGEKPVDHEMKKVDDKKEKAGEKNEMGKLIAGTSGSTASCR